MHSSHPHTAGTQIGTSRKRKEYRQPKKLTDFYSVTQAERIQDGARGASQPSETQLSADSYTDLPDENDPSILPQEYSSSSQPPSGSSSTSNSPAKSRMRLDNAAQAQEVRPALDQLLAQTPLSSPIAAFPTSNQPVIDTMLKEMLISLHSSLHNVISSMFTAFKSEMVHTGNKIGQIEKQMAVMTETVNDLVDAHDHTRDEHHWVRAKMADLEDRSRRNNVKIRGIPENILPADLNTYARTLISTLLPDLPPIETIVDRIHRLPKPPHLPAEVPRDTLMRIHFYHAKDMLLAQSRRLGQLPAPYSKLQLFPDISQFTRQQRRQLQTITKPLHNHKIPFQWGFPTKLVVTKNGARHNIHTVEEGIKLLRTWGIIPEVDQPTQPSHPGNSHAYAKGAHTNFNT